MKLFILLIFSSHLAIATSYNSKCQEVFDWVHKDLVLNNMQETMKLTKLKVMLAVITSVKNSKKLKLSKNTELLKHYKSLSVTGNKFTSITKNYRPLKRYKFWRPWSYDKVSTLSFEEALHSWKDLQQKKPKLFKGLDQEYLLNDWDIMVAQKMKDIFKFKIEDHNLASELKQLYFKIQNKSHYNVSMGDIHKLKDEIQKMQEGIYTHLKSSFGEHLDKFQDICQGEEMIFDQQLNSCNLISSNGLSINSKLNSFSELLGKLKYTADEPIIKVPVKLPKPDKVEQLKIKKVHYRTSSNKKATYCIRDTKALSSITIHHTGTSDSFTPHDINRFHLNRSTKGDPWYMIGYHYLISSNDQTVSSARPIEYRGAHTGGYEKRISNKEFRRIKDLKMTCAHDKKGHKNSTVTSLKDDFVGNKPHGNLTNIGIAIIGNYETHSKQEIAGVTLFRNTSNVLTMIDTKTIEQTARLVCKLQRQYPHVKTIRPHSYYRNTACPGQVRYRLKEIQRKANTLGCTFKVELSK